MFRPISSSGKCWMTYSTNITPCMGRTLLLLLHLSIVLPYKNRSRGWKAGVLVEADPTIRKRTKKARSETRPLASSPLADAVINDLGPCLRSKSTNIDYICAHCVHILAAIETPDNSQEDNKNDSIKLVRILSARWFYKVSSDFVR